MLKSCDGKMNAELAALKVATVHTAEDRPPDISLYFLV